MYEEHALVKSPPTEASLWRYMDLPKFISILEHHALFFVRSDKLGDPFEGSFSKLNKTLRPIIYKEQRLPEAELNKAFQFMKEFRRFTLINCWHESDIESEAMWRLYSRGRDGIVIRTSFGRLRDSLKCDESVYIGRVNYVDYRTNFTNERNLLAQYLDKRKSFEHEREVRAIMTPTPPGEEPLNLREDICDVGVNVDVDIDLLIQEVVIDARADDWFLELIRRIAITYGVDAPISRSLLAEPPTW